MAKHGGRRAGAGAPKGNQHTVKHGIFSKRIVDEETRKDFDAHYAALKADPVSAMLANAALIAAHVSRVMRYQDEHGFFQVENVDVQGDKSSVTTKRIEITEPLGRALYRASQITMIAHDIEAKRQGANTEAGATVVIQLHPDIVEE